MSCPGESGLDLCRAARTTTQVLSHADRGAATRATASPVSKLGPTLLTKPFSSRELLARVRAVLRRMRGRTASSDPHGADIVGFDDFATSGGASSPRRKACWWTCPPASSICSWPFIEHANRVLSRDMLMEFAKTRASDPFDRTIDVQVSRLRRKLSDGEEDSRMIKTVRGAGYMFTPRSPAGDGRRSDVRALHPRHRRDPRRRHPRAALVACMSWVTGPIASARARSPKAAQDRALAERLVSIKRAVANIPDPSERDRAAHALSSSSLEVHWSRISLVLASAPLTERANVTAQRLKELVPDLALRLSASASRTTARSPRARRSRTGTCFLSRCASMTRAGSTSPTPRLGTVQHFDPTLLALTICLAVVHRRDRRAASRLGDAGHCVTSPWRPSGSAWKAGRSP